LGGFGTMRRRGGMNTVDEEPIRVDRKQVISFIGKYVRQFAQLASEQGCATLSYMLQITAEQAEKEFAAAPDDREPLTTAHSERGASPGLPGS
jgi:hypothetical protein